jgi:hypothetical protein
MSVSFRCSAPWDSNPQPADQRPQLPAAYAPTRLNQQHELPHRPPESPPIAASSRHEPCHARWSASGQWRHRPRGIERAEIFFDHCSVLDGQPRPEPPETTLQTRSIRRLDPRAARSRSQRPAPRRSCPWPTRYAPCRQSVRQQQGRRGPARRGHPWADQIATGRWTGKDSNGPLP